MLRRFFPLLLTLSLVAIPQVVVAQSVDQLIQQGEAARNARNYAEAEAIFRRAIEIDPNYAKAYANLCNVLDDQDKLDEAVAACRQAVELRSNYAYAHFLLGFVLKRQNKLEEAIANFNRAIEIDPNYTNAYNCLGNALSDQGKLEEAIANYNRAIELDPNLTQAYYNLGNALYNQGKLEEAITAYKKSIEIDPNDADAYYNLGVALSDQGKLEEAIANFNRAIEIDPNNALAYTNLGNALTQQGKLEEALASYNRAIEIDPNDATAYNNLGKVLYDQGKLEEAITSYNQALSLPDQKGTSEGRSASAHTLAHNNLGVALQQQGKLEEAIAEYQRSIDLDPNFALAQNNLKEAERLLAIKLNPPPVAIDDRKHLPSETDEPLVKVLRSTARIIAQVSAEGNSIGAGWVVKRESDTVWIVTNRHVISDRQTKRRSNKIEVEFFSELPDEKRPRYNATIEKMTDANDLELDLAVLKVAGIPDDIQPLELRPGRVSRNTRVRVIGHPFSLDDPWNSSSGEVMNYDRDSLTLPVDAYVAEGNSGGPVIDEQNQVIAVMVRIRTREDIAIALDPNQPTSDLSQISPATGDVGLAYRIDIVIEKLRVWRILD